MKELASFEDIHDFKFTGVGVVSLKPYLTETNPKYHNSYYEKFTVVIKGPIIGDFVEKLKKAGYDNGYPNSITLVAAVKKGYQGEFPVRNMSLQKIDAKEIKKGSRVMFSCKCSIYKNSENCLKVQFNMKWLRKVEKVEESEEEREPELGEDDGPIF
jgi:hypothetical protein